MSKIFPTLYKKAKTEAIQVWSIRTEDEKIITNHGALDGAVQEAIKIAKIKNAGRANETTVEKQADSEAESMWKKKKDKGYFETIQEAEGKTVFLPMLAHDMLKMTPKKVEELFKKDFYTQPKMDGVRCLAYLGDDHEVKLMSRGGKEYNVKHLKESLRTILIDKIVLDGELYIHNVLRQDIQALVKKHKDEEYEGTGFSSKNIEFWVYDCFHKKDLSLPFSMRKSIIDSIPNVPLVIKVPSIHFSGPSLSEEAFKKTHKFYVQNGFEGTIIRRSSGKYELGHRSRDLIKYKDFMDAEFEIVGVKDGNGKYEGCAMWICKLPNGKTVDVNPKGTLEQKKKWFKEADKHIGKLLTVKFQGYTKDGNLEFPVGLGFRLKEDL